MENNSNQKQTQHQEDADPTSNENEVPDHEVTVTSSQSPPISIELIVLPGSKITPFIPNDPKRIPLGVGCPVVFKSCQSLKSWNLCFPLEIIDE